MTPKKFYDYLEGKLSDDEREQLERALIHDPELQRQFVAARQVHRSLEQPPDEAVTVAQAGVRGRQIAAACAILVILNVGIGLFFIFRATKPTPEVEQAREAALRARLQSSLEKSASELLPAPTIAPPPVVLTVAAEKQDEVAQKIIAAANGVGGSGAKTLPNENGVGVLVLIPAAAEAEFRNLLTTLGAPPASPSPSSSAPPDEPVHLEIVLAKPH
jgi:hypothetical protein